MPRWWQPRRAQTVVAWNRCYFAPRSDPSAILVLTLPETNSSSPPKNGWLEYFLLSYCVKPAYFQGRTVSVRQGKKCFFLKHTLNISVVNKTHLSKSSLFGNDAGTGWWCLKELPMYTKFFYIFYVLIFYVFWKRFEGFELKNDLGDVGRESKQMVWTLRTTVIF